MRALNRTHLSGLALALLASTALSACMQQSADVAADHKKSIETKPAAENGVPVVNAPAEERIVADAARANEIAPSPPPAPSVRPAAPYPQPQPQPGDIDRDQFPDAKANPVKIVAEEPVSTFSADVDTASYAVVRRYLNEGRLPPSDAVRIEEMVNYFDYTYKLPETREKPFEPSVAVYATPWNAKTEIVHIGIQGYDIPKAARPALNLTLLLDVSGSMDEPNKLPLLKRALTMLMREMTANDKVSIVVYAGAAGVVLDSVSGAEHSKIEAALEQLQAGGSTAGGEGIRKAYQLAEANFIMGGVNRVILATDGDFNVGITDPGALEDFVARKRETGVTLTVLGFGGGNYNDALMQKLAQSGNGNAAYIDTLNEARKALVDEMAGTLFTIAGDVKFQVEFNPSCVKEYRLIGYETRLLDRADFNNDKVDAGDLGAGHRVTALYEITPVGSEGGLVDPLRYQTQAPSACQGEIAYLKMRYKLPGETSSRLIERAIGPADRRDMAGLSGDMKFASAVAGFAQLLRRDPYLKDFGYEQVLTLAQAGRGEDKFGYRAEFLSLVRLAESAAAMNPLANAQDQPLP